MPISISGDGSIGSLSATEIGYLDGVTSPIQTQINNVGIWQTWTPTVSALTVGNGTLVARYSQIGKVINFKLRFTFGSTSSISNSPTFSLPIASVASSSGIALGTALIIDSGTTYPTPACAVVADSNVVVRAIRVNATYIEAIDMSSTIPWTWAINDIIDVAGTYEAA